MTGRSVAFYAAGRTNEAEQVGEQALDAEMRVLGREDAGTLWTMTPLAGVYFDEGRVLPAVPRPN